MQFFFIMSQICLNLHIAGVAVLARLFRSSRHTERDVILASNSFDIRLRMHNDVARPLADFYEKIQKLRVSNVSGSRDNDVPIVIIVFGAGPTA